MTDKQKKIIIDWSRDAPTLCIHGCFKSLDKKQLDNMLKKFEGIILSMTQNEWDNFITESDYSNERCFGRITGLIEKYKDR